MTKKMQAVEVRMSLELLAHLKRIARRAGVSPELLTRIMVVLLVDQMERQQPPIPSREA